MFKLEEIAIPAEKLKEEISFLEEKLLDLKKRMPAHSKGVQAVEALESLEEILEGKRQQLRNLENS